MFAFGYFPTKTQELNQKQKAGLCAASVGSVAGGLGSGGISYGFGLTLLASGGIAFCLMVVLFSIGACMAVNLPRSDDGPTEDMPLIQDGKPYQQYVIVEDGDEVSEKEIASPDDIERPSAPAL